MRVLRDFLVVRVKEKYKETVTTESGVKLFIDTTFRPEWHVTMEGECVITPDKLSDQYFEVKGISPDVKVGDKVYFNYLCVDEANEIDVDGEILYKVDYPAVFGYKRDGEINMIGSWVFVKPFKEDKGEKIGSLILPEMMRKETHKDMGVVWKIGKPLKHELELSLKEGDKILFRQKAAFPNQVENTEVYCMKQSQIMAKISDFSL